MKRKLLAMLLCLCMVMTMLPTTALAAESTPSAGEEQLVVYPGEKFSVTLEGGPQSVTIGGYMDADDWYVTDGLVLMYDGIYNAGMNESKTDATSWVDLTGNVTATNISTTWAQGATVNSSALKIGTPNDAVKKEYTNGFTVETAVTLKEDMSLVDNTYVSPFNSIWDASIMSFRPNNAPVLFYNKGATERWVAYPWGSGKPVPPNTFLQYAMSTDKDDNRSVFAEGVEKGAYKGTSTFSSSVTSIQLPQWTVNNVNYPHTIHLLRIYDRKLTANEMARNAAVDKARYEDKTYQAPGTVKCGDSDDVVLTEYDFEKKAMTTTLDSVSGSDLTLKLNNLGEYTLTFQVGKGDPITKSVTVISETEAKAADAVITQINALPETDEVSENNLEAIGAAQNAYNNLSENQKARVGAANLLKSQVLIQRKVIGRKRV